MSVENATPTAEIIEIVETPEERTKREEKERSKLRSALGNQINGHLRLVSALLDELIVPDVPEEEQRVITSMIRRHYSAVVELLLDYRTAGGEHYMLDRGLLRHYFGE